MNTTSSHPRMYDATSGGGLGSPSPTRYKMNGSSSARNNHQSTVRISTMSPGGFNRTLGSTNSKPLLDFSTISNGFTPASGLDRKGFSRLPLEANSSLHSEYEYNGIHEMLASLALMCLLSLLMAFLALFFLQRTGPSVSLTGDEGSNLLDSKLNKNNLNSAISQTRIVLNAKEYAKVYQISVALSTLTISLNLCCLFVCCIQFLSAVKLLKTPQGKKRTHEFLKKTSHVRVTAIGAFLISIPILFTGIILFTFINFDEMPALATSIVIGIGIVFCGIASVQNVYLWQWEKTKASQEASQSRLMQLRESALLSPALELSTLV